MDEQLKHDLIVLLDRVDIKLQHTWGVQELLARVREMKERVVNG